MLALGPVAFLAPWLLAALAVLPILWWLLRVMPPVPRLIPFPAIRLLFGLHQTEETPHHTPWWLLLLRLLLAALIIIALAHPLLNPGAPLRGSGPLLLVVDDGWAAAKHWDVRQQTMTSLIDQAERDGKAVMVLTTAPPATGERVAPSKLLRPADARRVSQAIEPKPWPVDRVAALAAIEDLSLEGSVNAVWLTDGYEYGPGEEARIAVALAERLMSFGALRVISEPVDALARLMPPPEIETGALTLRILRPAGGAGASVTVSALGDDGRLLSRPELDFAAGATETQLALDLPLELRNRLNRLVVEGENTAGAVVLLDERFRRRPVGLVSGETAELAQPLLGDLFYLQRALIPFSELRTGPVTELLKRPLAVLVLADIGTLTDAEAAAIEEWTVRGGILLRFAGPRLAEGDDRLLPVAIRRGGRAFGGVMTWSQPARLSPFEAGSPFAGLSMTEEVTVYQQVLAEPSPDLGGKVWARLGDGTPLVTGARQGGGWLVLFHTTANNSWSNLAISGLYVEMLRRIVGLSQGVAGSDAAAALPPLSALDGFGRLGEPPASAISIRGDVFELATPGPKTPPGFYGNDSARRALNLGATVRPPLPLGDLPSGVMRELYGGERQFDLKPWLLVAALALLLTDFIISLAYRGLLPGTRTVNVGAAAAGLVVLTAAILLAPSGSARAQEIISREDAFALKATGETRLAYVITGVPQVDTLSEAGLTGLSAWLNRRTSVEAAAPMGVDVEVDELSFFPLLYWPMSPEQQPLTDSALSRINDYLRKGGTILFDMRDPPFAADANAGMGRETLQRLVGELDLPPLVPVPPDHVLTKSFYLLQDFPGRWTGGTLWVQQPDSRVNDGVSPIIVGGNDWAAAWAVDGNGQAMYPVVPGGERQREMAFRFGINLVMYALTGNYKADQVHVPAILERLGQ